MSTKKIIFIIILIILILLAGIVIWRYNVLNNLSKKYEQSTKSSNIYYHSENKNFTIDYWRKGDIAKIILTNIPSNTQIIQWINAETNENITVYPNSQTYSDKSNVITHSSLPKNQFIGKDVPILLASFLPTISISSKEYNGQQCYCIKSSGEKDYINKETGLSIYAESASLNTVTRKYEFNTVTDENVEKPDITGFEYQQ